MTRNAYFLLMVFCCCFLSVRGQVIQNYDPEITVEQSDAWYLAPEIAKVNVGLNDFPLAELGVRAPAYSSIFIDGTLWLYVDRDTTFSVPLEELAGRFPSTEATGELTFFKKGIHKDDISVRKGYFKGDSKGEQHLLNAESGNEREKPLMEDFFVVAALTTFSFLALFKAIYPLVIGFVIRPVSAFSTEDFYESNSLTKFLSEEILIFLIIFNMLLMLLIIMFVHYLDLGGWSDYLQGDLYHLFFVWLIGTGFLTVLSWTRFAWLKIAAMLFSINKFEFTHFFFMLRIVSVLLALILVCLFVSVINGLPGLEGFMQYLLWTFFAVYFLGVVVLYFIMVKKLTFKNYHLFSYLCTAELVPFLVLSKLIIG